MFVSLLQKNASMTLKQAGMARWVKQTEKELTALLLAARVIDEQLWCCCGFAGIVIVDSELQQQRTLPAACMSYVFDVAKMSTGDVVVAASQGLYHRCHGMYVTHVFLRQGRCAHTRLLFMLKPCQQNGTERVFLSAPFEQQEFRREQKLRVHVYGFSH